jgi:hypothetical protein
MKMEKYKVIISVAALFLLTFSAMFAANNKKVAPIEGKAVNTIPNKVELQADKDASEQPVNQGNIANPAAGEEINWQVISGGGDIDGSSTNFLLSGTVSQTAVGAGGSANFGLGHGFWLASGDPSECGCIPGDANNDGSVNVGDAVYVIAYVFTGGPEPWPFATCSGDANCDCATNVGDAVYCISYVFQGGPPPCTCEEWVSYCGEPIY